MSLQGGIVLAGADDKETVPSSRASALFETFTEHYPGYQYVFVDFLVDHLTDLSRSYGGDLQQVMVLAIIGQRWLQARREMDGDALDTLRATAISASRLADVTGIPRETVRRKLALMQAKGWVAQGPDGAWFLALDPGGRDLPVRRDHADLDHRGRWRVARLVAALEALEGEPP
jgi:hypothetical protein